jgi:large subunit ribosomal protein L10
MKKIGLVFKETSENRIKDYLKDSSAVIIIKYSGLSSPDLSSLRQSLKSTQARMFVVKNSVARRALKNSGLETIVKSIEGPCGIIFSKDEPVEPSRVLFNFSKDHERLKVEGGVLKDRVLEKKDIEAMSKLPTKAALRAEAVMALNSPIAGLVMTLNNLIEQFVYCLDQIKEKKPK